MVDTRLTASLYCALSAGKRNPGQVAQLVERGPEKAGVGGSIPSLATKIFKMLQASGGHGSSNDDTLPAFVISPYQVRELSHRRVKHQRLVGFQ